MKKSYLIGAVVGFFAISACAISIAVEKTDTNFSARADLTPYTLNVNSTIFGMSSLTTTYQQSVVQDFTAFGKPVVLNYSLAKKDNSGNLVLAPAGRLFNYKSDAEYKGRVTNILSLTINYSGGKLFVQEGIGGDATQYSSKTAITSGTTLDLVSHPNFIMISNSRQATTITGMSITYSCSEAGFIVERLGEKYNGKGADGNVYTLTRNGNNISINNGAMEGTISVDDSGNFTMTLDSGAVVYTGSVSSDYKTLSFAEKSGADAASAPSIDKMNRVYVLDDFESYSQRGTGYTADMTSAFTASDLRADYYVDAGSGSGATWVYGSPFKIPSTSNYLNISTSSTGPVHSGNQAMLLQGQKTGWVRLWSRDVFNQSQHFNYGSGNKLSFWVHSGRNNPDGTGVNSSNVSIRAQVYYQNFVLTDSSRNPGQGDNGSGTKDFTINSGSGWNECILNLDPTKTVYAINIMINNSGLATDYVFMPIDDITIYTEPVYEPTKAYEETATQFTRSYHGSVKLSIGLQSYTSTVKIGLGANGYIYAYAGTDMQPTDYVVNGNQIVIHTTGNYSGISFGDWTGTLSNDRNTLTINKADITGDITDYMTSSSIVMTADTIVVDGSEGDLSGLENKVLRQYNDGSWKTDSSNPDRLAINSNYHIQGNNSISVKPNSAGHMRVTMKPSVAQSIGTMDSVAFWFYVPAGVSYNIQVYTYMDYEPQSDKSRREQQTDKTYDGSKADEAGWHYLNIGLNVSGGYGRNFAIFIGQNAANTVLDYITYFN